MLSRSLTPWLTPWVPGRYFPREMRPLKPPWLTILSQVAIFHAKCVKSAYAQCVSLLGDVLFRRVFDGARLAHAARNLLSDATEQKREGEVMAASILKDRLYASEDSNIRACNIVRQQRFLTGVLARLASSPGPVEDEMGQFVAAITSPDHVWIQVLSTGPCRAHIVWAQISDLSIYLSI